MIPSQTNSIGPGTLSVGHGPFLVLIGMEPGSRGRCLSRNVSFCLISSHDALTYFVKYVLSDELIYELAFDWITGNVYGVTLNGVVFVCDPTRTTASSSCVGVLTGQVKLEGVAVNPVAG